MGRDDLEAPLGSMKGSPAVLPRAFFARSSVRVARDLIGARLLIDGAGGTIVETEAYDRADPASHSHRGPTPRNAAMFGPPGHAYVYRSHGLHWCLNFVCDALQPGSAVLVRAIEPTHGLAPMRARRGIEDARRLCAGPGRLCQALGVTLAHDGLPLNEAPFLIEERFGPVEIAVGSRIGISRGSATPWRFGLAGSAFLSRRFARRP